MAFKFVILAALVAVSQAGFIGAPLGYAAAPVAKLAVAPVASVVKTVDTEYDPNPQYSYAYDVQDALTGDSKSQHETRNGDVVQGSYSLLESDGTRRTVDYTADSVNGFNAVVHKEPAEIVVKTAVAAPLVKAAAPVYKTVAAAPAYTAAYATAPVAHYAAAPVAQYAAAPVAHYAAAPVVKTVAAPAYTAHYAAPVAQYAAAPVAHYAAAPVAQYAAAPVAHYAAPVAQYAASPVAHYAAPVAQYAAAPVAQYASAPVAHYAKVASYAAPAYYH